MKMTYTEMFAVVRDGSMSFAAFVDAMGVLVVEAYEAGLREGSRAVGSDDAFELGRDEGHDEGYAAGYAAGKAELDREALYEAGYAAGKAAGKADRDAEAFDAVLGPNPNKKGSLLNDFNAAAGIGEDTAGKKWEEESDQDSDEDYHLGWADGYDAGVAYAKDLYEIED